MGNSAETRPDHRVRSLRGRRYAIPFEEVWTASLALIARGGARWKLVSADDESGVIRAEARTILLRFVDDVEVRISLDTDAQTRVDMTSTSRKGLWDLGVNARRIRGFLTKLDRRLKVDSRTLLPPESGRGTETTTA